MASIRRIATINITALNLTPKQKTFIVLKQDLPLRAEQVTRLSTIWLATEPWSL